MKIKTLAKLCGVRRYKSDTPSPDAIFSDANKRIFHQDDALFQLSNILHYHLRNLENYQKYSDRLTEFNKFLLYGRSQNIDGDYSQYKPLEPTPLHQPPIFFDWYDRQWQDSYHQAALHAFGFEFCDCG